MLGPPAIFLTVNPCDVHSPIVLKMAGIDVNFDTLQDLPARREPDVLLGNDRA